jgi:hypothetical protein
MKILVVCFVLALAAGKSFRTHSWEALVQIDNTPYGKRLLDTIELQMQSKASVDRILELLKELKDELNAEQARDDAVHEEQELECSIEIGGYNAEIDRLQGEIAAAQAYLGELRPKLDTVNAHLVKKVNEINALSVRLADYEAAHKQDEEDYQRRIEDHQEAAVALAEVLANIRSLVGSEAGAGKHETSVAIDAENKAYGSLIQLAADQETVAKLVANLEQIQANLESSIVNENAAHDQAVADFKDLKSRYLQTLSDLEAAKDELVKSKKYLEGEISVTEEELARDQDALKNNQNLKATKEQQCEQWRQTYFANTKKRNEEISVIDQLVDLLKKQLGGMSDYLTKRVQN